MTIGDAVEWASQAAGRTTTKRGVIAAVIPAGMRARDCLKGLQKQCYASETCIPRNHESYVVHVPSKTGKGAGKLYWPRVKHLRLIAEGDQFCGTERLG